MPEFRPTLLPESGEHVVGSVGHLISAVLQTAGLYLQGDILLSFSDLLGKYGLLFFVIGLMGAIGGYLLGISAPRLGLLITGTALFFFTIGTTVRGSPTEVRVGSRLSENAAGEQIALLKAVSSEDFYGRPPTVSWVFARLDRLISSVLSGVSDFLLDAQLREDLLVTAREQTLAKLFSSSIDAPEFQKLVALGLMGECAEQSQRVHEQAQLQNELEREGRVFNPRATQTALRLQQTRERLTQLRNHRLEPPKDLVTWLQSKGVLATTPTLVGCDEVYEWTWKIALMEAEAAIAKASNREGEVPWQEVERDIRKVLAGNKPEDAPKILAAFMFKQTLSKGSYANISNTLIEHSPLKQRDYDIRFRKLPLVEGQGMLMVTMFFSTMIPYVQGLLLFFLAGAFPFFCFFLLIPEHFRSFFLWISLWLWVKSWDIGFALLVSVKHLLWEFLGRKSVTLAEGNTPTDLQSAMRVIEGFDPMAGIGTYYVLVGILTMAIPVITAQLCTGASELLGAFNNAIEQTANRLYHRITWSAKRPYASDAEQEIHRRRETFARSEAQQWLKSDQAREYARSGDGLLARGYQAAYQKAFTAFNFSEKGAEATSDLAYFSKRATTFGSSGANSGRAIAAMMNDRNREFVSPHANQALSSALLNGSEKPIDRSTGLPNPGGDRVGAVNPDASAGGE